MLWPGSGASHSVESDHSPTQVAEQPRKDLSREPYHLDACILDSVTPQEDRLMGAEEEKAPEDEFRRFGVGIQSSRPGICRQIAVPAVGLDKCLSQAQDVGAAQSSGMLQLTNVRPPKAAPSGVCLGRTLDD